MSVDRKSVWVGRGIKREWTGSECGTTRYVVSIGEDKKCARANRK